MSKLVITLKSDLCAASGDGFSSVIDTDVSYDRYGFPLIGARRLKGCLRAAAVLIGVPEETVNAIFGVSGNTERGALRLSDAHLRGYAELVQETGSLNAAEIISLFTVTRSATAIENDTAMDSTLRFTRVIQHYSPLDGYQSETVFEAEVTLDEAYHADFADICRALRNIGYKRNRGFGAVQCAFQPEPFKAAVLDAVPSAAGEETAFSYTVRLTDALMLPAENSTETADRVSGTSVLGYFAAQYLRAHPADDAFERMFLTQKLRFSDLVISDENGTEYLPAPPILGKIKGESGVKNIVTFDNPAQRIIKPVKSGWCDLSCCIRLPLTETVYHHKSKDPKREQEEHLYTQTALSAGQYFRGTVSGAREYVEAVYRFLCDAQAAGQKLQFGRSKTAQYSGCELVRVTAPAAVQNGTVSLKAGDVFVALLLSDLCLPDGRGGYDITAEGLQKALGSELDGLCPDEGITAPDGRQLACSALRYRVITGYNTAWNLKKPHIRTLAAGSALVFRAGADLTLPQRRYIGAKQNEGFGAVMFCRADAFCGTAKQASANAGKNGILTELLDRMRAEENMRSRAVQFVAENSGKYSRINAAQLGRYVMMVKQSESKRALEQLTEGRKSAITDFRNLYQAAFRSYAENEYWKDYLLLILTLLKYEKRGG